MTGLRHYAGRLLEERGHVVRFLASRVLWRTGLPARHGLRVNLPEGVSVRFDRSNHAAMLWLDRDYGIDERRLIGRLLDPGGSMINVGDMWTAMDNTTRAVAPGGRLFVSIYDDQGMHWHVAHGVAALQTCFRASHGHRLQ